MDEKKLGHDEEEAPQENSPKQQDSSSTGAQANVARKMPISVVILVIALLVAIIGYYTRTQQSHIINQESAYGISGKITAIDDTSLTILTPTLPVQGMTFNPLENWVWKVGVENTIVVRYIPPKEGVALASEKELENLPATKNDLMVGMPVTITTEKDFSDQFMVFEKKIQALEIKIYE